MTWPRNFPIGIVLTLFLAGGLYSQEPLTDPVPDPLPADGIGISLVPFAKIPDSPATGKAPRLNMLKEAPDGSGRLFVIDQLGYLYLVQPDGKVSLYLNIRDSLEVDFIFDGNQTGSTSFAFHPDFAANGKFYLVTSSPAGRGTPDFTAKRPIDPSTDGSDPRTPPFHDILVEFTTDDPASGTFSGAYREVLRIEQPYGDHNVGEVAFNPTAEPEDPDFGLLYLAVADGGNKFPISDADPENNGQDPSTILGSIIRIDPLGTSSTNGKYGIPADNPFASGDIGFLPEIWSYGHRNHHRMNWDLQGDHALYSYEMGQEMVEEVNRIVPGGNYGWGIREGTFLLNEFKSSDIRPIPEGEAEGTFKYPVFQYDHPQDSGAIAGGAVYRGSLIPSLYGRLVTADFTGNRGVFYGKLEETHDLPYGKAAPLHHLAIYNADGIFSDLSTALLGNSGTRRTDLRIHTDGNGELYFTNKRNGWIHRVMPPPDEQGIPWPRSFPNGYEAGSTWLYTESLGFVHFAHWPWIFNHSIGWLWIAETGEAESTGNWFYIPR